VFDLVHPDDAETATRLAASVLTRRGVEQRGELRVAHAAGHYETVELTAVNLLEDPSVEAVVITSRNVTERKEAERELTAIRDSALALADQRAAFVASVSHELRTPVHAVLGLTELLTERVRGSEDAELVAGIRREAERLQSTVDDLLEHSRFEAQGITLRVMPVDVSALVARVVQRAAATSYGAKLTITSAIGPGMPTYVAADEHRLEQVLTNLVANAVKFTAAGEVRLAASWSPDGSLAFEVADTGPGIPASHRELIFEPFVQVPDVAGATGGSGLGLALVRGLLSAMGGTVALDCPPEGGSVFRVEVPAPAAEGPADIAPPPGPDPGSRGVSVLVVEDNEVNQQLAREQLLRLGHRATVVGLATEALAILAAPDHDHDIVLMDWQLPELDGVEATRLLRAAEAGDGRRRVPVIAMTASALPDDRAHCRDAGMDDFLPKPVSLRDLKTMIDKWAPTVADTRSPDVPRAGADRFDASALETLVSDLDDRPAVMSLVSRYLVELDERERELRESAAAGEIERVRRVSHTLRSTSEMMGALGLGDLCRALEASTPEDDLEATMSRFTDAAARARSQLQHWIDEHETPS
jgi:signal transduction histidine kinase/DNA-binding response OmpR family regulator